MRAVIRLRSGINANIEVKDTLRHLRLNKINHCVLIPEGDSYNGMLQKVKDYVTWGEIKPEVLTNMLIKRGRLTGNRKFDIKYIKDNTESENMVKYAENLISGKERYADMKEVQPVFRLHPPLKGHKGIKKSFRQGGDLGYRGEDINNLILKMLGPAPAAPAADKKPKAVPAKKAAEPKDEKPKAAPAKAKEEAEKKEAPKKSAAPKKEPAEKKAPAKKPAVKKEESK